MSQDKQISAERARNQIVEVFNQLDQPPARSALPAKQKIFEKNMTEANATFNEIMKLQQMLEDAYRRCKKEQISPE